MSPFLSVFWMVSCILAGVGMIILGSRSYRNYVENPVSFLIDRDRLEWNTTFPSVSVCETDADLGGIGIIASRIYGEDHDLELETFLRDIVFYDGRCYSCDQLCGSTIDCTDQLTDLVQKARQPCRGLLKDCKWMGRTIDCCTYFKPLATESGVCFTLNSLHTHRKEENLDLTVNRITGPGFLEFKVMRDINLYLHNTEDVPFINIPQEEKSFIILGTDYKMSFSVTEIDNDPNLSVIPVAKRRCRFPEENNGEMYKRYSYSCCVVDCRARAQLLFCNCTHHMMPYIEGARTCDLKGLSCLSKYSKIIGSLRTASSSKPGLVCDCEASCLEHDLQIVENILSESESGSISKINIMMKSLPETRFKRYIVRSTLDLVVSLGGTGGLFLGVSLLSVVEWGYILFIRRRAAAVVKIKKPILRIFWTCACITAMYGTYKLLMASWYNFQNNAVSFVVETSYLDWNTTFAAVSICENESPDKIYESGTKLFGEDRNMNMDFYLRDIAFFDGACYSCKNHCMDKLNCTRDLDFLVNSVRATCEQLIDSCMWNGEPFDCCSRFLPLVTELGLCFTINSVQTKQRDKSMKLISNRIIGPGQLDFQVYEAAKLFIHSRDDVPYVNHPLEEKGVLNWGTTFSMSYQVNEIENDPLLKDVSVEQRSCRFPDENILDVYEFYSYSACVVDCRAKAQAKFCNCTHHFMPKLDGVKTCDLEGLICLTEYSETLRALRTKDNEKKGLVCECMSSCTEPEYTVVSKTQGTNEDYLTERYGSKVSVRMDALPSQRFKRNVVRTRLDLVVSMGGTAGLFIGASLLSLGELFVFMLLRHKASTKATPSDHSSSQDVKNQFSRKTVVMKSPKYPSLISQKPLNYSPFTNPYIHHAKNDEQQLYSRNLKHQNPFHYLS